jgi:hypothetical protein
VRSAVLAALVVLGTSASAQADPRLQVGLGVGGSFTDVAVLEGRRYFNVELYELRGGPTAAVHMSYMPIRFIATRIELGAARLPYSRFGCHVYATPWTCGKSVRLNVPIYHAHVSFGPQWSMGPATATLQAGAGGTTWGRETAPGWSADYDQDASTQTRRSWSFRAGLELRNPRWPVAIDVRQVRAYNPPFENDNHPKMDHHTFTDARIWISRSWSRNR